MSSNLRTTTGTILAALVASTALAAPTPAQKCQSSKNMEAGRYANCRQKAEAKFALTGNGAARTVALQKCLDRFEGKWAGLEAKAVAAGGACPSVGDQAAIRGFIDTYATDVAAAIGGGALPACVGAQPLKTGQTTCFNTAGSVIPCAGTGQDGELQRGLARAYADNGDGTITDVQTGLTWEKLSDDGSIHDKDDTYAWDGAFGKITALNAGSGFAGFTDWRLPNINELLTLSIYNALYPSISPAFDTACAPGCSVLTCSCTTQFAYWSSTTYLIFTTHAFGVNSTDSYMNAFDKTFNQYYVRAVRGGA